MAIAKGAIVSVLPALIVMARFLIPGDWSDGMTWFFAVTGLVATLFGCLAAVVVFRHRVALLSVRVALGLSVAVAVLLLAIFTTMPSWPFTGIGFVVSWVLLAAGLTLGLTYAASYKNA
jgi:hypothetical protein